MPSTLQHPPSSQYSALPVAPFSRGNLLTAEEDSRDEFDLFLDSLPDDFTPLGDAGPYGLSLPSGYKS